MILNDGTLVVTQSPEIIGEIRSILERIRNMYFPSDGAPAYDKIRLAEEYNELNNVVRYLQIFNPEELHSNDQKKAFWLNLYNMLTLHGILRFQIKLTVWERPNFFISTEYNIGGYRFSLYDIAHGVLRGNRRRWRFFPPPFRGMDPRVRFSMKELDPRIHFALNAGSRSCPKFNVFSDEHLNDELDTAARQFINSDQFVYDPQTRILTCSKIFKWFARDFGTSKFDRFKYYARYIDDSETKRVLQEDAAAVTVQYLSYDWHLNSSE